LLPESAVSSISSLRLRALPLTVRGPGPIICAKRSRRQARLVCKIRLTWVVVEGVAHGQRLRHLLRRDFNLVLRDNPGRGPEPLMVGSRNCELVLFVATPDSQS